MASSSSSCNYEVFLSFRGEDTREIFTCHLYDALFKGKKIKTFIDDEELRRGDEISPALLNAIQGSQISVIIFSKDYASSKWCLNELVKILECMNTNAQIVIPVFYNVSPSDVRHQTGIFGERFDELQQQFKEKPEMVRKWKGALTDTSHLAGHESTKFRNDAKLVAKIVDDVLEKLKEITVSADSSNGLVGLNSQIEQIKPFLCMDLSDTVQIVGIWGMGGIGKTTLATAIFNRFSSEFEGRCFLSDVRRNSETGGGLEHLQKQILSTILSEKLEVSGPNIPQFTKERLRRVKVLIVLDDVNKVGQLEGLIGGLDQYGPGSRLLVTTRDKRVLEKFGVEEEKIYRVNGLKFHDAYKQFCNFAFKENHCPEHLKCPSRRVVKYADGNPLVLKVLGSTLKSKSHWENVLDDLNRICESGIHDLYDILKISFNELMPKVKSIFLDIACFFEGENKDFVARILDDSESYGLDVLIEKSLVTISRNHLQMHDALQDMGRQIVCQESEKEPGKRSRLWDPKEIRHVLKHNKGTDAIEGIFLDLSKIKCINLDSTAYTNMSNLRILKFYISSFEEQLSDSKVQLPDGLDYLPKNLRYLHWHKYLLRTLPSNFKPKNLVALNLPYSKVEQLWEGKKKTLKLKFIDLSYSQHLIEMPDLSETPNLERKYILDCTQMACVSSSIQNFNHLSMLCFKGCKRITSFPSNLHFVCPIRIDFSFCVNLTEFPQISGIITKLNLSKTAIKEVPSSIECLNNLEQLSLANCALTAIAQEIGCLSSLKELWLGGNNFESLPASIKQLSRLSVLNLGNCSMLQSIPELPLSLEWLNACNCRQLQSLPEIPSCLDELDASVLEELSKHSFAGRVFGQCIEFRFNNCFKLDEESNNKYLADSQLRIQHMAILSLRLFCESKYKNPRLNPGIIIILPGSNIPEWFSNQSSGSEITLQLPPHCRQNLIGFALCAVLAWCGPRENLLTGVDYSFVMDALSGRKHVHRCHFGALYRAENKTDHHVILGFTPLGNVGFPDDDHHATISFKFSSNNNVVKCCGVCPVYANPNVTKPNTYTLNFATQIWKLDDTASASGTSDEEELAPSPKRICRDDQLNTP